MHYSPNIKSSAIAGPLDDPLTALGLPARDTTRWTARRKAEIVEAVKSGLLNAELACEWYALTIEELDEWQRAAEREGTLGLRVTATQRSRNRAQPRMIALVE